MNSLIFRATAVALFAMLQGSAAVAAGDDATIERGRYLALIGACNDCHTVNWAESSGKVAEADWLTGSPIGWSGPWGTSYPANLRLVVQQMSEADWLARTESELLPPMPWFNLARMTQDDRLALYHYIRSLGPKGEAMPPALPPGAKATTPYFDFTPKMP